MPDPITANHANPGERESRAHSSLLGPTVSLGQIRVLGFLAPVALLAGLEIVRRWVVPGWFEGTGGFVLYLAIVVVGSVVFCTFVFRLVQGYADRLERQHREMVALHESSLAIQRNLDVQDVLQGVVEEARRLCEAQYGALSYLNDEGSVAAFLTAGIAAEERAAIGPEPAGHGVLGIVLRQGQSLRLDRVEEHPAAIGFPPHHPPMYALLAVPIVGGQRVLGNLYIAQGDPALRFSPENEETLHRFAGLAAIALENARLHAQVQALATTAERERIAREMHDGAAQVLGYVITKAQATRAQVGDGQLERADASLRQMEDAAREAYADIRESILGLRTSLGEGKDLETVIRDYVQAWQDQSGIVATLDIDPQVGDRMSSLTEVQLLRIVQEALTNVRKHAGATGVTVRIAFEGAQGAIVATIRDNGRGMRGLDGTAAGVPRFGLASMRERAESIRGTFTIASEPGKGTIVGVELPDG
ncbi:MAG: GAF domain-containing sensor histidine kinase [Thermomicrobiales bacterium]